MPYKTFDRLRTDMLACTKCRLRETCTQVVPGMGDEHADILFIGEGPGKNEDEQGLPFVGAAGKLLDEMLSSIDMDRSEVYIANVVKCRPPGNRDPQSDEAATCRPWLDEQIRLIDPKLIVTLGRHAMGRFLPPERYSITKDHGRALRKDVDNMGKRVILALYHPAAALYNGSLRETLFADFAKIPKILTSIEK